MIKFNCCATQSHAYESTSHCEYASPVIDKLPDAQLDGDDTYATSTSNTLMDLFTYRPDLTALDTGVVTSLDSITTAEVVLTGTVLFLVISGVPQYWRLVLGTDEESIPNGFIRPYDYHATTNARVWSRLT